MAATFGEDPLLAGDTAAAEVAGIQAQGTMAVVGGSLSGPGGSGLLPRSAALHELYLQPVEDAVRAGAAGVLCSPGTASAPGPPATQPAAPPAGAGAAGVGPAVARPAATHSGPAPPAATRPATGQPVTRQQTTRHSAAGRTAARYAVRRNAESPAAVQNAARDAAGRNAARYAAGRNGARYAAGQTAAWYAARQNAESRAAGRNAESRAAARPSPPKPIAPQPAPGGPQPAPGGPAATRPAAPDPASPSQAAPDPAAPNPAVPGAGIPGGGTPGGAGPAECGDAGLLIQILRHELGFTGFVLSGQGADPGPLSLDSGLDGEIAGPTARHLTPAALRAAIASRTISVDTINEAAGAVLAEMDRFGLLSPAPQHRIPPAPVAADERVVARTAQDAATLLKNSQHALPLSPAALRSLALIGPGAEQVITAGPGDGTGDGTGSQPGPLAALRHDLAAAAAGDMAAGMAGGTAGAPGDDPAAGPAAHLRFAVGDDLTGTPVPASALSHEGQPGLVRGGTGHGATRVVSALDNTVAGRDALPAGSAHTWTGELTVPVTGTYRIGLATGGSWGALTLDGAVVAQDPPGQAAAGGAPPQPAGPHTAELPAAGGLNDLSASVTLSAGTHTLGVAESPDGSGRPVQVRLDWVTPAQQQADVAAAVATARNAKAAVVFAWGTPTGGPTLPAGQNQLIRDVAAANPDTIVILNTPGPVAMPWLGAVRAVLEMWYPGDAGGDAAANVLLGRADPAGRLPMTWPASRAQASPGHPTGIFVGYRRYDRYGLAPLFPFGYGLSYTRFSYSGLRWHAVPGAGLVVRFLLANTGRLAGETVPQVYLGAPASAQPGVTFAARALAAYTRVGLRPGESRLITLRIPQRQLQFWDDVRGWVTAPGRRPLYVGPDERSSALATTVIVPG